MITPPAIQPDRATDCEMALADEFESLASRAQEAGWSRDVVVAALLALSLAQVKVRRAAAHGKKRTAEARNSAEH